MCVCVFVCVIVGESRVHNNLEDLVAFHKTVKDGEREGVCVCVCVCDSGRVHSPQ